MFVNINTEVEIAKKYNLLTTTSLYVIIHEEKFYNITICLPHT